MAFRNIHVGVLVAILQCVLSSTTRRTEVIKTICFETVSYYYSNKDITGKKELFYTYQNDDIVHADVYLSCDIFPKYWGYIANTTVFLMLPATEEEFCIETNGTDDKKCTLENQCQCCVIPKNVCKVKVNDEYYQCNSYQNCVLKVSSKFLDNCTGRTYNCNHTKCHSRWAEIHYLCKQGTGKAPPDSPGKVIIYNVQLIENENTFKESKPSFLYLCA